MELPAVNTRWSVTGTGYKFEIKDFWSRGSGDRYKRTIYELKYDHRIKLQYLEAERLHELITENKIELIDN